MPTYIVKLSDNKKEFYLEWSTITDSPITYGMSLKKFKKFYLKEYGISSKKDLEDRLTRVEQTGTSSFIENLEDTLEYNKAGRNEKKLTLNQLIEKYCYRRKNLKY